MIRLAVPNSAAANHRQGLVDAKFQHVDVFTLVGVTATIADAIGWLVAANELRLSSGYKELKLRAIPY